MFFRIALYIVLFLLFVVSGVTYYNPTKRRFLKNAREAFKKLTVSDNDLITLEDLSQLPEAVKKYLLCVGVVGKEKTKSYYVEMSGGMKLDEQSDFSDSTAKQYSFHELCTRLFYMTMKHKGLKVVGYHQYANMSASMIIKILDVFKVVDVSGEEMLKGETVTLFNDMCLFAPGTLIDERITWEEIDPYNVKGTFINQGIQVSAILTFNEKYQLIDFKSEDRYMSVKDGTFLKVPWSTPISEYATLNGYNLISKGSAIWHLDSGEFEYFRTKIKEVRYNEKNI